MATVKSNQVWVMLLRMTVNIKASVWLTNSFLPDEHKNTSLPWGLKSLHGIVVSNV